MPFGVQVQVLFRAPRLWESRSKSRTLAAFGRQVLFRAPQINVTVEDTLLFENPLFYRGIFYILVVFGDLLK